MKKVILVIDGNAFCYRAFYAIHNLATSTGMPTNAIYGFITMLQKLLAEHQPDYLAVTFDLKGPTFRHHRFADYKLQRKPMPDALAVQIPIIKKILAAYRIAIFEQQGFEADDLMASLARKLSGPKFELLIVTGDKDILQIVNNAVKIINPHKDNLILDQDWVKRRYGVTPDKFVEIIGLAGDASDNIPGVPGIGEAAAIDLIKRFGSLDQVLANTDKIANKTKRENIKQFAEQAKMSRELAKLDCSVEQIARIDPSILLKQLERVEEDKEQLYKMFKELELKSLLTQVVPENRENIEYQIVAQGDHFAATLQKLQSAQSLALYFSTTKTAPTQTAINGIALSLSSGENFFFVLKLLDKLKPVLEDENIKKIGHNLKLYQTLLSNYGIRICGMHFDTMIAAYLLNPAVAQYRLTDLAQDFLHCKLVELDQPNSAEQTARICCQNATVILKLSSILNKTLKQKNLLDLFQNVEMPLIAVLADMEKEGVVINKQFLLGLSSEFEKKLQGLTKDIYALAGSEFNINSPKQLAGILFEKLKLPKVKRTKTGASTDTGVLQKLAKRHPIARSILEFRELAKLSSTYIAGLIKLLNPQTGRLHTSFNQAATATGRLSSSHPNLQNIPIRTKLGRKIREAFIPIQKDSLLLSADYSQIELRILAHMSEDKNLISAFEKDLDIHAHTASLIFGLSVEKISEQKRNIAKTVNFAIIYGMSYYGLSKDLGIEHSQAQEFIDAYFRRYPGVQNFITEQIKQAEKYGFVTTLLKRRRYIPEIKSENENLRQFAQRVAINAPVQGSASDLIKVAMIAVWRKLKTQRLATRMLLQVHDELVFSVPRTELVQVQQLITDNMERVFKLKVPLKVTIKAGQNWLEVK